MSLIKVQSSLIKVQSSLVKAQSSQSKVQSSLSQRTLVEGCSRLARVVVTLSEGELPPPRPLPVTMLGSSLFRGGGDVTR